jgi:hypothetical protein
MHYTKRHLTKRKDEKRRKGLDIDLLKALKVK